MSEFLINVPDELVPGFKKLDREEVNAVFSKALKERLAERLMFKVADELLKDSEITDELALEWGSELKEKVARQRRK
jgi:hypothetical protein